MRGLGGRLDRLEASLADLREDLEEDRRELERQRELLVELLALVRLDVAS